MAAVAASAPACGSALAASPSSPCSLRRVSFGRTPKLPCHSGYTRIAPFLVRATTSTEEPVTTTVSSTPTVPFSTTTEETSVMEAEDIVADLRARWDAVENKKNVLIYTGGAVLAIWLSATIVGAVNSVPLLPKILELVGLGYSGWFVYRYLLFKESRKELAADIEDLKAKITGAAKDVSEEGLE